MLLAVCSRTLSHPVLLHQGCNIWIQLQLQMVFGLTPKQNSSVSSRSVVLYCSALTVLCTILNVFIQAREEQRLIMIYGALLAVRATTQDTEVITNEMWVVPERIQVSTIGAVNRE